MSGCVPVGSAAAILTTQNSVKILRRHVTYGKGAMASCATPTFTAFKSPQPLIARPVSSWRSGWKLLKANGIRKGRHFTAFDSELRFLKLYKHRHFRQGWLPNAASGAFWAHHIERLKPYTAVKNLEFF